MLHKDLEAVLFVGALAALAGRRAVYIDGDLAAFAEHVLRRCRPRARA
jgi:hypothetical protein